MEASEFRARIGGARGEMPFVLYDATLLQAAGVGAETAKFLADPGLPRDFALLSQFDALDSATIDTWHRAGFPPRLFPIGSNGGVSFYGIELASGQIVEISTDWQREIIVNSSVDQLAETLCLFEEHSDDWPEFILRLSRIDPAAAQPGCYWPELAADFQALNDL